MHFEGLILHSTAILLCWLGGIVAIQFLDYPGMLLLTAAALLLKRSVPWSWLGYIKRARWLLLTLWLIIAGNTPGDAIGDFGWAPTYQGVAEANLQAARLLAMLALLAGLLERLGRDGLVDALWGLLRPLGRSGLDTARLVVRLSLVMSNLQSGHEKGAWKNMLSDHAKMFSGPQVLHVAVQRWKLADTFAVLAACCLLLGVTVL